MQALPEILLTKIFDRLSTLKDFVVCSAVSKRWAKAIQDCRPGSLDVHYMRHDGAREETEAAISMIAWLQSWRVEGRLQKLHDFRLGDHFVDTQYRQTPNPTSFSQAVVVIASFCNLQTCRLHGCFCVKTAAAVLPPSLISLYLWPEAMPAVIPLSKFSRLTKLQKLEVGCDTHLYQSAEPLHVPQVVFDTTLSTLQSLGVWSSICCSSMFPPLPDIHLPKLCNFYGSIQANQAGKELANTLVGLPHLQEIAIEFRDGDAADWTLVIPKHSAVLMIELKGPPNSPKISLKLEKQCVNFRLCGIYTVDSATPPDSLQFFLF